MLGDGAASGVGGQLDPVGVAELLQDVLDVRGNGTAGHEQALGDLPVGHACHDKVDDLQLGRCETFPSEPRPRRCPASPPDPGTTPRRQEAVDVVNRVELLVDGLRLIE